MRYVVPGATLALVVLMVVLSWGEWDQLYNLTIAPLVILVAWFQYRDRLSAWASLPALLQAGFGFFNVWGHQLYTPAFLQAAFGFTISSGHRLYLDVRTYDFYLLSVDGSFGFQPSIWLRQTIDKAHLLWFFTCVYDSLPLGMAVAYVAHFRSKRLLYIPVVLTVAIIGVPLYWILPASGPIFLLGTDHFVVDCGSFCSNLAAMTLDKAHLYNSSLVDPKWPRNCLPSLHVTWALLIFWICRDLKWGRWIAGAFLICTALSTMIVGEHYLVDVITAIPLSLIVWQVCVGEGPLGHPRRVLATLGGVLALLLWIATIRMAPEVFWLSPVLSWSAAILTIACSLIAVSPHPDEQYLSKAH
jgi:PAP2 superfamily